MPLGPLEPAAKHLLRAERPYACRGSHNGAHSRSDCHTVPGLANTETVNLAIAQGIDQERRRYHHEPHLAIRIYSGCREPIAQLIVMTRERVHHREGERLASRLLPGRHHALQSGRL